MATFTDVYQEMHFISVAQKDLYSSNNLCSCVNLRGDGIPIWAVVNHASVTECNIAEGLQMPGGAHRCT